MENLSTEDVVIWMQKYKISNFVIDQFKCKNFQLEKLNCYKLN